MLNFAVVREEPDGTFYLQVSFRRRTGRTSRAETAFTCHRAGTESLKRCAVGAVIDWVGAPEQVPPTDPLDTQTR